MKLPKLTDLMGITKDPKQEEEKEFDPSSLGKKEVFLKWKAVSRVSKLAKSSKFTRTFTIIGVVIALFLIIMEEYALIFLIASIIFVTQVLSKTPPEEIDYELSNHGIKYDEQIYYWFQLKYFFFTQIGLTTILNVDTKLGIPGRLFITIEEKDKKKIQEYLSDKIEFLTEEPKSFFDKAYDKISDKFNFD